MIVVVDTSTLISALIKPDGFPERALIRAAQSPNQPLISVSVLEEYREVIMRAKFDRYAALDRRLKFIDDFVTGAKWVTETAPVRECSDPDDDKFLELAFAGRADVIVSSDLHLLAMHPWRSVAILSPAGFLAHPA